MRLVLDSELELFLVWDIFWGWLFLLSAMQRQYYYSLHSVFISGNREDLQVFLFARITWSSGDARRSLSLASALGEESRSGGPHSRVHIFSMVPDFPPCFNPVGSYCLISFASAILLVISWLFLSATLLNPKTKVQQASLIGLDPPILSTLVLFIRWYHLQSHQASKSHMNPLKCTTALWRPFGRNFWISFLDVIFGCHFWMLFFWIFSLLSVL